MFHINLFEWQYIFWYHSMLLWSVNEIQLETLLTTKPSYKTVQLGLLEPCRYACLAWACNLERLYAFILASIPQNAMWFSNQVYENKKMFSDIKISVYSKMFYWSFLHLTPSVATDRNLFIINRLPVLITMWCGCS